MLRISCSFIVSRINVPTVRLVLFLSFFFFFKRLKILRAECRKFQRLDESVTGSRSLVNWPAEPGSWELVGAVSPVPSTISLTSRHLFDTDRFAGVPTAAAPKSPLVGTISQEDKYLGYREKEWERVASMVGIVILGGEERERERERERFDRELVHER